MVEPVRYNSVEYCPYCRPFSKLQRIVRIKAQLEGAWIGSSYVITDVIDKESYSNAPGRIHVAFEYDSFPMTSVMT
jgi:hypothetical protein